MTNKIKDWMLGSYSNLVYRISRVKSGDWLELILILLFCGLFVGFLLSVLAFCILWPLALVWLINYLFGTAIPISFFTWLAVIILVWGIKAIFGRGAVIKITRRG